MSLKIALRTALKANCGARNFSAVNLHECTLIKRTGYSLLLNKRQLHTGFPLFKKEEVTVIIQRGGQEMTLRGKEGDSILEVIENNKVDIPGYGACEGTLSCSTCHVKISPEHYDRIAEGASDEELDMLDLAPDVCNTSRLGCQVYLSKELEGIKVEVPSQVKDMREVPRASV